MCFKPRHSKYGCGCEVGYDIECNVLCVFFNVESEYLCLMGNVFNGLVCHFDSNGIFEWCCSNVVDFCKVLCHEVAIRS